MAKLVLANYVGRSGELKDPKKRKIEKLLANAVTPALLN
jgi:hypothetical protein